LAVGIVERSAINERLTSLVEISATEHHALEVARQALRSLKAQQVDAMVGETLGP